MLTSHALGACLHRLLKDWKDCYGIDIAMVVTFFDTASVS